MSRLPTRAVLITLAFSTAGPLVYPNKVAAEDSAGVETTVMKVNETSHGPVAPEMARQEAVAVVAEKLLLQSFRTELQEKLQDELVSSEQDLAQARQRLNAAKALEDELIEKLKAVKHSPSVQDTDPSHLEEELVSVSINIDNLAEATLDALARVNGFSAVLEELTKLGLQVEAMEAEVLQRLRYNFNKNESPIINLSFEISDRLYALGIVTSYYLSENRVSLSSSDTVIAVNPDENEQQIDWIFDKNLQSTTGEDIGSINDVIMDDTGEIKAVIIGLGGFLGIGEKQIIVPWDQLQINYDTREITSDMSSEEAEAAPEYVFRDRQEAPPGDGEIATDSAADPIIATGESAATASTDGTDKNVVEAGDPRGDPPEIDPTVFMPELFPWPPPEASARATISRSLFGTNLPQNLGEVADVLQKALADAGYTGVGYLGVPGGFAMITRIEQYDNSGRPLSGKDRWASQIVVVKSFSISGIIRALMTAEPGFFRVLVLVITDKPFSDSRSRDRLEVLERWSRQGLTSLVPVVEEMPFSKNHRVTALVYEFEKTSEIEDPLVQVPGRNEAPGHLSHTRFSQFLE